MSPYSVIIKAVLTEPRFFYFYSVQRAAGTSPSLLNTQSTARLTQHFSAILSLCLVRATMSSELFPQHQRLTQHFSVIGTTSSEHISVFTQHSSAPPSLCHMASTMSSGLFPYLFGTTGSEQVSTPPRNTFSLLHGEHDEQRVVWHTRSGATLG
jgi:hypothetical protein